jgi:hypothetical protein
MSLAGAAWTVGCLKAVAESGAQSVTLFQTTGLRGLMERDGGSGVAEFHSTPGTVYPVYLVLASLADWRGAEVLAAESDAPLAVQALVLRKDGKLRGLVVNMTAREHKVSLGNRFVRKTVLHAGNVAAAVQAPDAWPKDAGEEMVNGELVLPPFSVAIVDGKPV